MFFDLCENKFKNQTSLHCFEIFGEPMQLFSHLILKALEVIAITIGSFLISIVISVYAIYLLLFG